MGHKYRRISPESNQETVLSPKPVHQTSPGVQFMSKLPQHLIDTPPSRLVCSVSKCSDDCVLAHCHAWTLHVKMVWGFKTGH